jgi:hypothetical protein
MNRAALAKLNAPQAAPPGADTPRPAIIGTRRGGLGSGWSIVVGFFIQVIWLPWEKSHSRLVRVTFGSPEKNPRWVSDQNRRTAILISGG